MKFLMKFFMIFIIFTLFALDGNLLLGQKYSEQDNGSQTILISEVSTDSSLKYQVKEVKEVEKQKKDLKDIKSVLRPKRCLLYTSPSPRDKRQSRMPSSA